MKKRLIFKLTTLAILLCIATVLSACDNAAVDEGQKDDSVPAEPAIYVIVRADNGSTEETDGAVRLRKYIRDTLGIEIGLETDWFKRGDDVEDHRFAHEIIFGDTNRNESIAAYDSLNIGTPDLVDYMISNAGDHYVIAASEGNMDAAVTQFISYLEANPQMLYEAPVELNDVCEHNFPLDGITVMGERIEDYGAIVYPISYHRQLIKDVQEISDLIFHACGIRIPVYNARDNHIPTDKKLIRIGDRADEGIMNAGSFSYSVDFDASGITLDSHDMYSDTRAIGDLVQILRDGIAAGGTLALDDSDDIRLENPEDKPRLEIAAYIISSHDMTSEEQFAEIKECGFNQVIISRAGDEALFHNHCKWLAKYELKALWDDGAARVPNNEGGEPVNGADYITLDPAGYAACEITWGHFLRDEPNADLFPTLAEAYDAYDAMTGDQIPYINLFPSYANEQQLGTPTYEEHLQKFFDTVDPQLYTSVDIYPLNIAYSINNDYFYNLDVFATECRTRGIPFAVYIQSVSFNSNKRTPDEQEMRWQAYCALSFGAQNIEYFTYRTPNSSTEEYKDALISRENEKTERWYGAQSVNAALALMSDAYMQYDNLGAFTVNEDAGQKFMHFANQYREFDAIGDIRVSGDKPVLFGAFASDTAEHSRAFTCVNLGDPGLAAEPIEITVELTEATTATMYYKDTTTTLTPDENNCITFPLSFGDGAFITLGN